MKKSLLSGAAAILVAMSLTGCGDDTKLETGTYVCTNDVTKETFKMMFDMEKNTWDIFTPTGISAFNNGILKIKATVGPYDDKTQEYPLEMDMMGMKETNRIKVINGEFPLVDKKSPGKSSTCKKEEK